MTIKLKDIKACPWNTRGEIMPESVKELADSINEVGLINPITLWKSPQGEVYCVAGNRRLAALMSLGIEIEEDDYLMLDDGSTENDARMVTVTENLQREDVGVVEEAELVKSCLDSGMTIDEVAAKTGRGKTWVRVRAKLAALDEKWSSFAKAHPNAITAEALENISAYPSEIQKTVWRTHKPSEGVKYGWDSFKWVFELDSYDIEASGICGDNKLCAKCKKCAKRTGAEADLFGDTDGGLGRCLDKKCFEDTVKAYREAAVKNAVGDSESVVYDSRWSIPTEADGEKRTSKNPCAYIYFDGGDIEVKWGPSKKKMDEAKKKAEADRKEADAARRDENARSGRIVDAIVKAMEDQEAVAKLVMSAPDNTREAQAAMCAEVLDQWKSTTEWAGLLATFDFIAERAELSDEDVKWFIEKHGEEG